MRMTLVEVHLRNFRIHEDYRFRPAAKGITSIIGDNGRGKSSIIDGIAWALYGAKPDGAIKIADLRRIGADVKDDCYVEVTMLLDGGRKLRVKRSIHGKGSVQCDCWMDGVLESGGSVSTADRWIPGVLGIDKDGFLSAVLVQQKQVGEIVSESASIRQRNIEKLTGITAATAAVQLARDDVNAMKKAMDMAAPDAEDMDSTRRVISSTEDEMKTVAARRETLRRDMDAERRRFGDLSKGLDEARRIADEYDAARHAADMSKQHMRDLQARLDDMSDRLRKMRASLPKLKDPKGLEEEYNGAFADMQSYSGLKAGYDATIGKDVKKQAIDAARKRLDAVAAPDGDRQALVDKADKAKSESAAAGQRKRQYEASLKTLDSGDDMVTCPTCLQPITDMGHVRDEFQRLIDEASEDMERRGREAGEAERDVEAYDAAVAARKDAQAELDDMTRRHADASAARRDLAALRPKMDMTSRQLKSLSAKISDIKANAKMIQDFKSYSQDFTRIGDEYAEAERDCQACEEKVKGMRAPSKRSIGAAEAKLEKSRADLTSIKDEAIELKGRKTLLDERLGNAKASLERAEKQEHERALVRKRYEVAQGSLTLLTAFREHLASQAVPQITDYASDLLSDITGGRFMAVTMDERYSITVRREDGSTLDVHMLSGGERDTVAICLRLAISMMLSGGEPSMLILDEVLTAMDDTMSAAILKTIQSSGHGQVIIIAHNDIVSTIADKPVEL